MTDQDTFLRLCDVTRITGLPRSTLYELIGEGKFPKQVPLSERAVAWLESEVRNWQQERLAVRDGEAA